MWALWHGLAAVGQSPTSHFWEGQQHVLASVVLLLFGFDGDSLVSLCFDSFYNWFPGFPSDSVNYPA